MDNSRQEIKSGATGEFSDDAEIEQASSKEAFDEASLKYQNLLL